MKIKTICAIYSKLKYFLSIFAEIFWLEPGYYIGRFLKRWKPFFETMYFYNYNQTNQLRGVAASKKVSKGSLTNLIKGYFT